MQEYKIFTFEEIAEDVGLTKEAHRRVRERLLKGVKLSDAVYAECTWPDGFLESLKGKTLEEQMACYRIVEERCYRRTAYGEVTNENKHTFGYALEKYPGLKALIVDEGILIGVRIKSAWKPYGYGTVALPYENICTYYASDNNGSGYKDSEDYAHLCCVMPDSGE